jgi:hypothetical protein
MQQEIYPNQVIPAQRRFKICGVLDMQYGGPLVCFLWIVCIYFEMKKNDINSFITGY